MSRALAFVPQRGDDTRKHDVVARGFCGLDYIDVRGDGRSLIVAFFGPLPPELQRDNFRIDPTDGTGALRVIAVRVASDEPDAEGVVTLRLDRPADGATYALTVDGVAGVDPLFATLPFTFERNARRLTDGDVAPQRLAVPARYAPPQIDYLAKDYATFRELLLDRATQLISGWSETHVADLDVTLIELLAYVGDGLSYFQDAVATEAYLSSARSRISVRRHARLLDYRMHDGCSARAWLVLSAAEDVGPIAPRSIAFATAATAAAPAVRFEPLGNAALHVYAAHAPISLYGWGSRRCTLPAGATAATLRDTWNGGDGERALHRLEAGMYLLFECVREIEDGAIAPADPLLRHVVRLTHVRRDIDPLYETPIVEIAWALADRLPFDLPVAAPDPADPTAPPVELSVAWGNVVLVDHGQTLAAFEPLAPVPTDPDALYRPRLARTGLTFAQPVDAGPAAHALVTDPRAATVQIAALITTESDGHERRWTPVADLLASGPADTHYVVEIEDDGTAFLRFGDGVCGRRPAPGATVRIRYRIGSGSAGNVGAEAIVEAAFADPATAVALGVRNPLPARGGRDPETSDEVRTLAPASPGARLARAITPADYAAIAGRDARLQRAAAEFRWTGSRTRVRVALDPLGAEELDPELRADVAAALEAVRRIGHDVDVVAATYVPLTLALDVWIAADYAREDLRRACWSALVGRAGTAAEAGLFAPDRLSFGDTIATSAVIAALLRVPGVLDVRIRRFERLDAPATGTSAASLTLGPLEIARLDADRGHPEHGVLELTVRGGR